MKVIDLLNKIANGEEVPKKIKYMGIEFTYIWTNRKPIKYVNEAYEDGDNAKRHLFWYVESFDDEVEIIEEDKKINKLYKYKEELGEDYYENILKVYGGSEYEINEDMSFVIDKINEIIEELNKRSDK